MPLDTDWETDSTDNTGTVDIQHTTSSPLNGNRSLRITCTTGGVGGTFACGAVMLDDAVHDRGFVMGRIRTLFRVESPGDPTDVAGIYCLGSSDVGISDVGDAYVFGPTGPSGTLQLSKMDAGLSDNTPALLFDTGVTVGLNVLKAIELEWKSDLTIFGGVQFILRAGDAIDFNDLAVVGNYTDETDPLLTSASEGLFLHKTGTVQNTTILFDDTTVIKITVV